MKDVCQYYSMLGSGEREQFIQCLCTEYCTDHSAVLDLATHRPDTDQVTAFYLAPAMAPTSIIGYW